MYSVKYSKYKNEIPMYPKTVHLAYSSRQVIYISQAIAFDMWLNRCYTLSVDRLCLPEDTITDCAWWRHQMETFSALLAICVGNSPVPGEFPAQWPVTQSFDIFFDLRLNKRLSKQSWGWWFAALSVPLWPHSNGLHIHQGLLVITVWGERLTWGHILS